jgi:hypothetical protein
MKKTTISLIQIFFLIFFYNSQTSNIDIDKVRGNIPFRLLNDLTNLDNDMKISFDNNVQKFNDNSSKNAAAVHIAENKVYYFNSYAITLLSQRKNRLKSIGLEFLDDADYSNIEINIDKYKFRLNSSPNSRVPKVINCPSNFGSIIYHNDPPIISTNQYSFRTPEFGKEQCLDQEANSFGSLIYATDKQSLTLKKESSYGECYNGYPIIVKETFEHYIKNTNHNYFDIMPNSIQNSLLEQLLNSLKNQKAIFVDKIDTLKIEGSFDFGGNSKFNVKSSSAIRDSQNSIRILLENNCISPIYENKFINSTFNLIAATKISQIKKKQISMYSEPNFYELFNQEPLLTGSLWNELKYTKHKFNYFDTEINIIVGSKILKKEYTTFTEFITPKFLGISKSLFGFGEGDILRHSDSFHWLSPTITIGSALTSVTSLVISKLCYQNYVKNISDNNLNMYNIANIGHQVNLISAGVYCLFSSINIYLTIKQVKDKRNKIRKINDEIKFLYPKGVCLNKL